MADFPEFDTDVLTESETKLEKPKLFKVILHNDDFTTMEFVVFVLEYVESSIVRRREDIERVLDLPVLASIPDMER